jgi:hypothetical protein
MSGTYITKFINDKVCPHTKGWVGFLKLPFINALAFILPFPWILVGVLTLIFYLAPCNPNLNCTSVTKKKDGQKAFVISVIIVYSVLLVASVLAKITICKDTTNAPPNGFLTNVASFIDNVKNPKKYAAQ